MSVRVRHLGTNHSAVSGQVLQRNDEKVAHHNDTISFLIGQYEYVVEFDPCKRKLDCNEPKMSKKARVDPGTPSHLEQNKWQSIESGKLLTFLSEGCRCSDKVRLMHDFLKIVKSSELCHFSSHLFLKKFRLQHMTWMAQ